MNARDDLPLVSLTVDEYETIRLIDLEKFTQEECARQMNVARTTVQGIYSEARNKIARFLVEGLMLSIEGGEYRLCQGQDEGCGRGCCHHQSGQGQRRGRGGRGSIARQANTIKNQEEQDENCNTGRS